MWKAEAYPSPRKFWKYKEYTCALKERDEYNLFLI